MPSVWKSIDSNFPSFTGEEKPQEQIRALHNYLFQLREGLKYSMQNLSAENFNAAALENLSESQKNEVKKQLEKVYALLGQMSGEIQNIAGRVSSMGIRIEAIEQTVQTEEDGGITIGTEGKPLRLVGEIYINGVLYGQGENT